MFVLWIQMIKIMFGSLQIEYIVAEQDENNEDASEYEVNKFLERQSQICKPCLAHSLKPIPPPPQPPHISCFPLFPDSFTLVFLKLNTKSFKNNISAILFATTYVLNNSIVYRVYRGKEKEKKRKN